MPIALILLAAGQSRRFGSADKLLEPFAGESLVVRSARTLCLVASDRPLTIVVPPNATELMAALNAANLHKPLQFVTNPNTTAGMGTSIAAGVSSLDGQVTSALITPADMPFLTVALIKTLLAAHTADGSGRPTHPILPDGTQLSPVIWPRSAFAKLTALDGDTGGKSLLAGMAADTVTVPDFTAFADIDTPDDLARLQQPVGKSSL